MTIDGLKFKVSSGELAAHLRRRAERHLSHLTGKVAVTDTMKDHHKTLAEGLEYMASHVHDGDYSLDMKDLLGLELVKNPYDAAK